MSHFTFTIGPTETLELYRFDSTRSKLSTNPEFPFCSLLLTAPIVSLATNQIYMAAPGTRFGRLIIKQYDSAGELLRRVEHKDVIVTRLTKEAPDLFLEYKFKP